MTATVETDKFLRTKTGGEDIGVVGNLMFGNAQEMSIDQSPEAQAHIIRMLTNNLYTEGYAATLRELSTNALDSHVEAGTTEPIQITLPSSLDNNFVVQDFGTGMSEDIIRNVYQRYGASTKRDNLNVVGAFGLGAKVPLTITDTYTLETVRDGRKLLVVVSRGESGVGEVEIMSNTPTDERNGTKITVPIADVSAFLANVNRFFYTWKPGTVLVDGKQPESVYSGSDVSTYTVGELTYHVFHHTATSPLNRWGGYNRGTLIVNFAGNAYQVRPKELDSTIKDRWGGGIYEHFCNGRGLPFTTMVDIPIGMVDTTSARDDLLYSDRTRKYLRALVKNIIANIKRFFTEALDSAQTRREALEIMQRWKWDVYDPSGEVARLLDETQWRGETVPTRLKEPHVLCKWRFTGGTTTRTVAVTTQAHYIGGGDLLAPSYYLTIPAGVDEQKVRTDLRAYLQHRNVSLTSARVLLFDIKPKSKWVTQNDLFTRLSWDEVMEGAKAYRAAQRAAAKAATSATAAKSRQKAEITYPTIQLPSELIEDRKISDLPNDLLYLKLNLNEVTLRRTYENPLPHVVNVLQSMGESRPLVVIHGTRKDTAFLSRLSDGTKAENVSDVIKDHLAKNLSPDEIETLVFALVRVSGAHPVSDALGDLVDKIDDPELANGIRAEKKIHDMRKTYPPLLRILFGVHNTEVLADVIPQQRQAIEDASVKAYRASSPRGIVGSLLRERYPLIESVRFIMDAPQDALIYVNAKFAHRANKG